MTLDEARALGAGTKVTFSGQTYDFGYVGGTGKAILHEEGEMNMQDSFAVDVGAVRLASHEEVDPCPGKCKTCDRETKFTKHSVPWCQIPGSGDCAAHAVDWRAVAKDFEDGAAAEARAGDQARAALRKISDIRDSIIGTQSVNWSEHVYPLVAALDEAGYPGAEYKEARKNIGTTLERVAILERRIDHHIELQKSAEAKTETIRVWWQDAKSRTGIFGEVELERMRQDAKWGVQDHKSADPALLYDPARMCEEYEIPGEARAKFLCQTHAKRGDISWPYIAVEELSEAVSAFTVEEDATGRGELVQLAAVIVAWIECIDRRAK
jgi:hypothetical protein